MVQKGSGFSTANGTSTAIDVSADPVVGVGVISGTVFSGSSNSKINRYTTAQNNLNFTKDWYVQAPGIKDEYDDIAAGNIFDDGDRETGYRILSVAVDTPFKLTGGAATSNLLRFSSDANNKLIYNGKEARAFSISASLSVRGEDSTGEFYSFFIRKNGDNIDSANLDETNSIFYVSNTTNISSISLLGTVMLEPGDFIEIWGEKLTGTGSGDLAIFSQNLNVN